MGHAKRWLVRLTMKAAGIFRDRERGGELVDLVALEENGPSGPPQELTWPKIETVGHGEREFYVARQSLA